MTVFIEKLEAIDASGKSIFSVVVDSGTNFVKSLFSWLPDLQGGVILIVVGILLIVLSITFLGKPMKAVFVGKVKNYLKLRLVKVP